MATSINADNGAVSGSAGLKSSADSSGVLALQTNGTTAISIDASQAVSFTNSPTVTGGTANGVAYLNGSKVLTTGSALAFNGSKLGIGVSSFDVPLQVQAITGGLAMRFNGRASPADGYSDIGFYNSANTTQYAGIGAANSGLLLATNIATPITFTTNNAEAGRFDSSGNLLVGTTSSATVNKGMKIIGGTSTSSSDYTFYSEFSNTTQAFGLRNDGNVVSTCDLLVGGTTAGSTSPGIGLTPNGGGSGNGLIYCTGTATTSAASTYFMYSSGAAAYRFYVDFGGTIHATSTSISAISDASLKTNIKDLETGLTEVMALKPRRFDWINGDATNVAGFIAQEVEQVLPELVIDSLYSNDENGNEIKKKNLKMGDILPTLVKAIQEQQALITTLTDRITALEAK